MLQGHLGQAGRHGGHVIFQGTPAQLRDVKGAHTAEHLRRDLASALRQSSPPAAVTAERTPKRTGTYWHVETLFTEDTGKTYEEESWTGHDGQTWRRDKNGRVVKHPSGSTGFAVGPLEKSFEELQKLPAEPGALKRGSPRT